MNFACLDCAERRNQTDILGSASSLRVPCPRSEGRILRELYGAVAERPAKERLRLQRLWELERAEFAISLITWTLLLWRTPWAKCICTARLQRHPPDLGPARISMLPCAAENSNDGCSFEAQHASETTNEFHGMEIFNPSQRCVRCY